MAHTAGVFTPSAIANAVYQERVLLATPRTAELNQDVIAGQAILMHQDPRIDKMGMGQACMATTISALRIDSMDKGSETFACTIADGVQAGTEALSLTKSSLVDLERFRISDIICNNAEDFASVYAGLSVRALANLEVKLSKALVAVANANTDEPEEEWFETTHTIDGDIVEVQKQYFTADLLADIQWSAKALGLNMPIVLNGRNFFNKAILDQYAKAGCCDNNAILTGGIYTLYWDSINVDQVTGAKSTLVIDKNSILFWNSPAYDNIGMENMVNDTGDIYHWVVPLPRLKYFANGAMQTIYVDVRAIKTCVTDAAGIPRNSWTFEMGIHGAIVANLPNADGYRGILRIDQVDDVVPEPEEGD